MPDTLRPVVVGVDASADAAAAITHAAWEADQRRVRLRLVHGYLPTVPYAAGGLVYVDPTEQLVHDEAAQELTRLADHARSAFPNVTIETAVIPGPAAAVLIEESRTAGLLVVGSRGTGGFAGLLAGSVSTAVATHAHCPVIVVRPPLDPPVPRPGPVVAGVDGSPRSRSALLFGLAEASRRGVDLIACYAWWALPHGNLGPITPRHYDHDEAAAEAERLLAEESAGCGEQYPEVVVQRHATQAMNPTFALIEESKGAGLLVVGSRGRGGFAGLLLGSVSRELVQRSPCPVAVIRTDVG